MTPETIASTLGGHKWWLAEIRFARSLSRGDQRAASRAALGFAGWDPFLVGQDGVIVRSGRWPWLDEARALLALPRRLGPYWFRARAECWDADHPWDHPEIGHCARCHLRGPRVVPWHHVSRERPENPLVVTLEKPRFHGPAEGPI